MLRKQNVVVPLLRGNEKVRLRPSDHSRP